MNIITYLLDVTVKASGKNELKIYVLIPFALLDFWNFEMSTL